MCREKRVGKTETECRKRSAGKIAGAGEKLRHKRRASGRGGGGCPCGLSIVLYLLQKPLQCWGLARNSIASEAEDALRKFGRPGASRARNRRAQANYYPEYCKISSRAAIYPCTCRRS